MLNPHQWLTRVACLQGGALTSGSNSAGRVHRSLSCKMCFANATDSASECPARVSGSGNESFRRVSGAEQSLDGAGGRKWSLAYVERKVGRAAEGYQLRRRQRGGHTQQRSGAARTEGRKGGTTRPKKKKNPSESTRKSPEKCATGRGRRRRTDTARDMGKKPARNRALMAVKQESGVYGNMVERTTVRRSVVKMAMVCCQRRTKERRGGFENECNCGLVGGICMFARSVSS